MSIAGSVNRLSWGVNTSLARRVSNEGFDAYLQAQLHPKGTALPPSVQAQIDAMSISQRSLESIVLALEQQRKAADSVSADDDKKSAQQAYQQELNRVARESAGRHVLRALYSQDQVLEEMTWFWINHFNVHQFKSNVRALVGDYEEHAIRPHALGKFKDLLSAVARHPAMLRYLDNEQNAVGHINENYARELMELHTLGVDAGYSQADVQELARVLTGVGVNFGPAAPPVKRDLQAYYIRHGLFEFNPNRHDFGPKRLLGKPIAAKGLAELDEALDRLSREPATARFISRKLAIFWMSDDPPATVVDAMARTFRDSDGDIASTLRTLFLTPDFYERRKFKDPMRYVISAVRLAYDSRPILNTGPVLNWLGRLGEPLYGRQTPDGYALDARAWDSAGQMAMRFEIAKSIGSGSAGLFRAEGHSPQEQSAFPQLSNAVYYDWFEGTLKAPTKSALAQANSPQEWNMYLLSSPEFMNR